MDTQIKQCNCKKETDQEKYARISAIIDDYKGKEGCLIQVLHLAQGIFGYLPSELQEFIAEGLNIPLTEVYGVVTFYTLFSTIPKGENTISVCMGTACYVKGAKSIVDGFIEKLGVDIGGTTLDGKFTLEITRCIGACGLAPAITINDKVYQKVEADKLDEIIKEYY
jgi:NADH:ubiquinone oxidoreductase subunit E